MSACGIVVDGGGLDHPRRVVSAALGVFLQLLGLLRRALEGQMPVTLSWSDPSLECRYPVPWSWTDDAPLEDLPLSNATLLSPLGGLEVFNTLTHGTGWRTHNGQARPLVTEEQKALLETLPKHDRHAMLDEIMEPFTLTMTQSTGGGDTARRNLLVLPAETFVAEVGGSAVAIGVRFEVHPLAVDRDAERAYYPVIVALEYSQLAEGLWMWLAEHGQEIWAPLSAAIERIGASLEGIGEIGGLKRTTDAVHSDYARVRVPDVGARTTFPERRRSVMSPVPMPRAVGNEARTLAQIRGLGRLFAGYAGVPDLDINGEIAVAAAKRAVLTTLEQHLGTLGTEYQRVEEDGRTVYTVRNCLPNEAWEVWATVERALRKGDAGPAIEARPPAMEGTSRFEKGEVVTETRIVFWPENELGGGRSPAVHFRSQSSPGYLALLEQNGTQPYFADGWLWIQRGREREGFRIGGLSALLFPEGRSALERMTERQIADRESELNRIIQDPQLSGDPDQKAMQELRGDVTRLQKRLASLSVYDVSHDLILCLVECFHRQRDRWARQEILVRNSVVSITPFRVLQLDPKELRMRLDPGSKWGDNWRARLFDRLSGLATFEPQTRTETGRKGDVGDRLVHRVIDGLRSPEEVAHPKTDASVGLVRLLRRAGALPSNMIYVEVSVDFIARLVTWAVKENGVVKWGLDAVRDSKRLPAPDVESGARLGRQPYYQHSPRLLALSNLEDWSIKRKLLASTLLQEMTPVRRSGKKGGVRGELRLAAQIDGRPYLACNGAGGHGYKIRTWMQRSGHDVRRISGRSLAEFIGDVEALVEALDLRIELGGQAGESQKAVRALHDLATDPQAAAGTMLRAYLPADLEDRLRAHLAIRDIEACESDEEAARGTMASSDLRSARLQAGLSQPALACAIGVSKAMICHWEHGKVAVPRARVQQIREALGTSPGRSSKPEVIESYAK